MDIAQPELQPQQKINGFEVRKVTPLPNLRSIAYELYHPGTGARLLHLHNSDAENLFSVTFPTPPPDDTGVPHILEHSVLAGSRKYQVKDPFFEMLKSSMATFINAMTGSDHTVYPVASNVKKDFYNLAEVYWDAVFHPLLTEKTFQREGHHLELANREDPASELIVKGIVFNEMKGARSSPESKVYDLIEKSLWPDTPYGKDSGGDPEHIIELTWKGLRDFHHEFYHPGKGYFFLYGDIPTKDHLDFLAPRLAEFSRVQPTPRLPEQPRWKSARKLEEVYAVAPTDSTSGKTFVVLNWLVGLGSDVAELFAFSALERILLGNQAAPLRKALIDSKLGEDLTHSGYWANGIETSFHVGLKGTEPDRAGQIEKLILDTLAKVADQGVSQERFDAAIQQLAYRYLEIADLYPLHLMGPVVAMWQHGGDPLVLLHAREHIEKLKRDFTANPQLFADLIRKKLLNNPHRLTLVVRPDGQVQSRKDAEFNAKLQEKKKSLTPRELQKIAEDQVELQRQLDEPNPPGAIAALPQLSVRDLPPKPRHIHTSVEPLFGSAVLLNNHVFANGVNYLHLAFDLSGLPTHLYPLLSIYGDCVRKMGAAQHDYAAIAERVAAFTGGIGFSTDITTRADQSRGVVQQAVFSTKFLDDNVEKAMDVLRDVVFEMNPNDAPRLKDVLLQSRAHQRMRPTHDGLGIALRHAARGLSSTALLRQITEGLPLIHLLERLAASPVDSLIPLIESFQKILLYSNRVTASFTGSAKVYNAVQRRLQNWTESMSPQSLGGTFWADQEIAPVRREGLAAPMNVAYCAQVAPAPHISHPDAPHLAVAARLLGMGYILEEVRFKGTAYGGGCGYSGSGETWTFHSYRDPWIHRTLDVYANALKYVQSNPWTQGDVDRAIIGTAKEGERPIRPGTATSIALWRHLTGDTPQRRDARHEKLLQTTRDDVRRVLTAQLESAANKSSVCVVSSRQKLEEANTQRPKAKLEISDILSQ